MKRHELLRKIMNEAKAQGKNVTQSEGGSHTKLTVGVTTVRLPRHQRINIDTARGIMRELDKEFGKGWSRL
jgi:mRNA interferase HicA